MCPPTTVEMGVLCPTPRRLARTEPTSVQSGPNLLPRALVRQESGDSRAEVELLRIFLRTEVEESGQLGSSPPFFSGSPPSRPANPVIDDPCFGEKDPLTVPLFSSNCSIPLPSSARKGNGVHTKFGLKPAAVRIEGFHCLNHGCCQCCSVTSVA